MDEEKLRKSIKENKEKLIESIFEEVQINIDRMNILKVCCDKVDTNNKYNMDTDYSLKEQLENLTKQPDYKLKDAAKDMFHDAMELLLIPKEKNIINNINKTEVEIPRKAFFNTFTSYIANSKAILIGSNIWTDIIAEVKFSKIFIPVEKHETLLQGKLGYFVVNEDLDNKIPLHTDMYRYDTLSILDPDTLYVILEKGEYNYNLRMDGDTFRLDSYISDMQAKAIKFKIIY